MAIKRPTECLNACCGAMCSPADYQFNKGSFGDNPKKCPNYRFYVAPRQPEAKGGKWEYGYSFPDGEYCKCSECKEIIKCIYPMHYCPNCGTKMEGKK